MALKKNNGSKFKRYNRKINEKDSRNIFTAILEGVRQLVRTSPVCLVIIVIMKVRWANTQKNTRFNY